MAAPIINRREEASKAPIDHDGCNRVTNTVVVQSNILTSLSPLTGNGNEKPDLPQ